MLKFIFDSKVLGKKTWYQTDRCQDYKRRITKGLHTLLGQCDKNEVPNPQRFFSNIGLRDPVGCRLSPVLNVHGTLTRVSHLTKECSYNLHRLRHRERRKKRVVVG